MLPPDRPTIFKTHLLPKHVLSLSAISSTLIKRTWIPFYSSTTAKAPPLLLISHYSSLRSQNPTSLSARLLPNNDTFKSPPEFPKLPNHQPLPTDTVPLEVPQISTTPEIDPGNTPPELNTNPTPYNPDPGPEFPKPAIPPQPDPGPELPIPPRPDPDIPLLKPDVVPPYPPDYVPQRPPGPEVVPPPFPDISPPTGPYVL